MKNFVRLVQFAWRYRVRFGLSIGCAAMVALLFFTELGAVYPLLHILFDSQNPKRWVAEKITSIENEIVILDARTLEARTALEFAENGQRDSRRAQNTLRGPATRTTTRRKSKLQEHEHLLGVTELKENIGQPFRNELARARGSAACRAPGRFAAQGAAGMHVACSTKSGAAGIVPAAPRHRPRERPIERRVLDSVQDCSTVYRPGTCPTTATRASCCSWGS